MAADQLPAVWRLYASGERNEAARKLVSIWIAAIDGFTGEQAGRVAIRLLRRMAPVTDDPEAFEALPEQFTVFRQGRPDGFSWSLSPELLYGSAEEFGSLTEEERAEFELHRREVRKSDVLALLTSRGESEVVLDIQGDTE